MRFQCPIRSFVYIFCASFPPSRLAVPLRLPTRRSIARVLPPLICRYNLLPCHHRSYRLHCHGSGKVDHRFPFQHAFCVTDVDIWNSRLLHRSPRHSSHRPSRCQKNTRLFKPTVAAFDAD